MLELDSKLAKCGEFAASIGKPTLERFLAHGGGWEGGLIRPLSAALLLDPTQPAVRLQCVFTPQFEGNPHLIPCGIR